MSRPVKPPAAPVVPGVAGLRIITSSRSGPPRRVAPIDSPHADWRTRSAVAIDRMIAWHVREMRKRAGLPQHYIAGRLGRPQSFIAKVEAASRELLVHELVLMCALMERDPCELLSIVVTRPSIRAVIEAAPPYLQENQ